MSNSSLPIFGIESRIAFATAHYLRITLLPTARYHSLQDFFWLRLEPLL
tara:strand:+ start:782 stop:928 length:147 start_codon:yes stop_codon:yes gene_type:complete